MCTKSLIQCSFLEWDYAIVVTLHLYTVWSCQAVSPTAWEGGWRQPSKARGSFAGYSPLQFMKFSTLWISRNPIRINQLLGEVSNPTVLLQKAVVIVVLCHLSRHGIYLVTAAMWLWDPIQSSYQTEKEIDSLINRWNMRMFPSAVDTNIWSSKYLKADKTYY